MTGLRDQLHAFASHLRDPDAHPAPSDVEDRRMAIYRQLVVSNLDTLLSANFPVIRRTLDSAQWGALVRAFLATHRSSTPLFPEIAQEFLAFLRQRAADSRDDPAWLPELAHYEWVELALQIADGTLPPHDPQGDLLSGVPVVSPLAWPLAYRWPVHTIGPRQTPLVEPASPTLLLVRRDASGQVHFSELSPLVYRLLELAQEGQHSGSEILRQLASEAQAADPEAFDEQGIAMLRHLCAEAVLLGTRV